VGAWADLLRSAQPRSRRPVALAVAEPEASTRFHQVRLGLEVQGNPRYLGDNLWP
jgi:hypothetical protein